MPTAAGSGPALRVLLVTDSYAPAVNGVVRSITDLRDGLLAAGHDVRVLTFGTDSSPTFSDGVHRLPSLPAGRVYPDARLGRPVHAGVLRELVDWGPDVVHSHTEFSAFVWARRVARRAGAAHVHTYHTMYEDYTHYFCPSERLGRSMAREFARRVLSRTDRIIAPTGKVAELLGGYGVAAPVDVIGTGVDLGRFRPVDAAARGACARELGLDPEVPVVLTVGRIAEEKNLPETLSALCSLGDAARWQWLVVGHGPDAARLRERVAESGAGARVHMVGAVPPDEVHRLYRAGDVFVTSSRSETQGLTCLEALASGVPVVCPDDEAFDGVVVDGVNGRRYRGEADLAGTLSALLSDADLRRSWSRGAVAGAADRGRDAFAAQVECAYRRAIAGASFKCGEQRHVPRRRGRGRRRRLHRPHVFSRRTRDNGVHERGQRRKARR